MAKCERRLRGSQAVFFKINTWGESAFTDHIVKIIAQWERA